MKHLYTTVISGLLLFSTNAQDYNIFIFDVKTAEVKQASFLSGSSAYNASWSNNGKKIAHDVVGPASPYWQTIYITDIDSKISAQLAGAEGGNDAAWSPDGASIAFDAWGYNYNFGFYTNNIYSVPAHGGDRTLLRWNSSHASWSPDGARIAFADNWGGYIGTRNLETGAETFVTWGNWPTWSPNGKFIAYNGWGGGVWVIALDEWGNPSAAPVQLSASGYGPTWAQNSKSIAYIDWPEGDPDLYSVSLYGGTPQRLAGQPGGFERGDYDAAYANNGQYIAYSAYSTMYQTRSKTAAQQEATPETKTFRMQNYPNPFRSQTSIAFTVTTKSRILLEVYSILGEKVATLTEQVYEPGNYQRTWYGKNQHGQTVAAGIYFYRLNDGRSVQSGSMQLIK